MASPRKRRERKATAVKAKEKAKAIAKVESMGTLEKLVGRIKKFLKKLFGRNKE
jgi:hypothetical protein